MNAAELSAEMRRYSGGRPRNDDTRSSFGDVRERKKLQTVVSKTEPEIVFHLAAQALVQRSYREPVETEIASKLCAEQICRLLERVRSAAA